MEDEALLISADERLTDLVRASAAATGSGVRVCPDPRAARRWWVRSPTVLIGADCAPVVAGLGLPTRLGVHVLGLEADPVLAWSAPLQAAGLVLPDQAGLLTALLDPAAPDRDGGRADVVRVVAATGGLGCSTLAAGLAVRAARRGVATVLVELDRYGGGIDLLFGAEDEPGWRWGDLASARGHLAELRGHLPGVAGVDLVAVGRAASVGAADETPATAFADDDAVQAVLAAARRAYDLVVLDIGRMAEVAGVAALAGSGAGGRLGAGPSVDSTLLLVGAEVRAVLAAQARLAEAEDASCELVVRTGPGRRLDPALVAETLGQPLLGTFVHDGRLPGLAESGDPPGRVRGATARACDRLLETALRAREPVRAGPAVGRRTESDHAPRRTLWRRHG